jgi:hypothetical protein
MKTSEQVDKLFPALVAAQHAAKVAPKDSDNPFFKSKYADLQTVWEAVSSALATNKLAVIQAPGLVEGGMLHISTRIIHESGQWLETEASTPLPKADPQGYGSAVTYMRRYNVGALLGVITGEDDDGNGASLQGNDRAQSNPAPNVRQLPQLQPKKPKGFPAKFDSKKPCQKCGHLISKGELVEFIGESKNVQHADCQIEQHPTADEYAGYEPA